jgi:hypothetical protein
MADYPRSPEAASEAAGRYAVANRGETVAAEVPVYRRWWQFWRPRVVGTNFVFVSVGRDQFFHWTVPS